MFLFVLLVVILLLFIGGFVLFLVYNTKMSADTFNELCEKKVKRIARRRDLLSITNLNVSTSSREKLGVHHVIFGKKYIYLITDFMLKGFVSGEVNDNSWVYFNNIKKTNHYVSNLKLISDKNIKDFAGILGIKEELIVSICLVPNECDFKIKGLESYRKLVVHYSSLNRRIRKLENQDIDSLNQDQIYDQFRTIERKNTESKTK